MNGLCPLFLGLFAPARGGQTDECSVGTSAMRGLPRTTSAQRMLTPELSYAVLVYYVFGWTVGKAEPEEVRGYI